MDTEDRLEFFAMVSGDVEFIRTSSQHNATDDQVRRISVELHKLLVEENVHRCWRQLGMKGMPLISTPEVAKLDLPGLNSSAALNSKYGTITIGQFHSFEGEMSLSDLKRAERSLREVADTTKLVPLKKYLDMTAIKYLGKAISRRDVIKYMAVKRGGKHWDTARRSKETLFKVLDAFDKTGFFGGDLSEDGEVIIKPKSPVRMQLLSIAQEFANSVDIQKLEEMCKERLAEA